MIIKALKYILRIPFIIALMLGMIVVYWMEFAFGDEHDIREANLFFKETLKELL